MPFFFAWPFKATWKLLVVDRLTRSVPVTTTVSVRRLFRDSAFSAFCSDFGKTISKRPIRPGSTVCAGALSSSVFALPFLPAFGRRTVPVTVTGAREVVVTRAVTDFLPMIENVSRETVGHSLWKEADCGHLSWVSSP